MLDSEFWMEEAGSFGGVSSAGALECGEYRRFGRLAAELKVP